MSYRRKTLQEKLVDKEGYPKILTLEQKFPCYNAVHKMGAEDGDQIVLVNPSEVIELMKSVPFGKVVTIYEICQSLAKRHAVNGCCSLTAGIFIMTAAKATEEAREQNLDLGIPYWRTLKAEGYLNEKYPGGAEAQKLLLDGEGINAVSKGKKLLVKDYRTFLFTIGNSSGDH
jgi:alkylated DNA nucleotide flippase Atl1